MFIKLYICTYNNPPVLNQNLESIFASDLLKHEHEITIINNYQQNFHLNPEFVGKVKVMHNVCRPDFSRGHLARTWNQCLLHGFRRLSEPDAKYVMTSQDDVIFEPDWCSKVLHKHESRSPTEHKFDFIHYGIGDMFFSYEAEAVRKIGIWDERFPNIGYQECDYMLRAIFYNRHTSSLNDGRNGTNRVLNPFPDDVVLCRRTHGEVHPYSANQMHCLGRQMFERKWPGVCSWFWTNEVFHSPPRTPAVPTFLTYPYFECDIYDLGLKGYFCDFLDQRHFQEKPPGC